MKRIKLFAVAASIEGDAKIMNQYSTTNLGCKYYLEAKYNIHQHIHVRITHKFALIFQQIISTNIFLFA